MSLMTVELGDRVWWTDPYDGKGSGNGIVANLQYAPVDGSTIIGLKMDNGGWVECLLHELSKPRKQRRC